MVGEVRSLDVYSDMCVMWLLKGDSFALEGHLKPFRLSASGLRVSKVYLGRSFSKDKGGLTLIPTPNECHHIQ